MNELQLKTTEMFGEVQTDIYENENHDMFMTARQLGECLGYKSKSGIDMLINRNSYLKDGEFSGTHNLLVPQGNGYSIQETRVFNEDGIYEVTFLANTDKAKEFRCWVRRLLKSLRKGDLQLTTDNITFSSKLIETMMQKYFGAMNDRLLALETQTPTQPNFWLWKKHIANVVIGRLADKLQIDTRTAYDLVYDNMFMSYGFDRSFAINQFCTKYNVENAFVIDAIADSPEYQREFITAASALLDDNSVPVHIKFKSCVDKVQEVIAPLVAKYNDKTFNSAKTYGKVYAMMNTDRGWKNLMTRNKCTSKKQVLLKNEKKFMQFKACVEQLLSETEVMPNGFKL